MASTKPTILFVPGAWHRSACYTPVVQKLNAQGYVTATTELASVGPVPGLQTWADDVASIQKVVASLANAGKRIVVVAHSYGSLPAGEAIKGFLFREREAHGRDGGVVHFVYISAFVLPPSTSLMDALGGKDLPWFKVSPSRLEVEPEDPAMIFYNDLPQSEQDEQISRLEVFSYRMYFQKTTWAPYKELASSFVYCTKDNAIPLPIQQSMVQGNGVQFRETIVEASHSPFLSMVDEVVSAIVGAADSVEETNGVE
jgi:pimeloyl-ACP methyl ester carboxylesterase